MSTKQITLCCCTLHRGNGGCLAYATLPLFFCVLNLIYTCSDRYIEKFSRRDLNVLILLFSLLDKWQIVLFTWSMKTLTNQDIKNWIHIWYACKSVLIVSVKMVSQTLHPNVFSTGLSPKKSNLFFFLQKLGTCLKKRKTPHLIFPFMCNQSVFPSSSVTFAQTFRLRQYENVSQSLSAWDSMSDCRDGKQTLVTIW